MRNHSLILLSAILLAGGQGCGRDVKPKDKAGADTSMAGMPGMEGMPGMADTARPSGKAAVITFTAAQIAHGGIQWAPPTLSASGGSIEVPGQLMVNEDRSARLAAPAQARILAVHVSPGDRVALGAQLVTLQSQEANMAAADVVKAQAEVSSRRAAATYAKAARDRAERLLALKAIPRQDYERAVADDALAAAALSQADAEHTRARSSAEQLGVDVETGAMTLRSPIAGVVTAREGVPGAVVSAGAPLVTVIDQTSLWLTVALPEQLASGVERGSTMRFTVGAYPTDTFTARVQSVSASFDATTRSLPVRGLVDNSRGRLRPEMFAKVWVEGAVRRTLPTVPDSAVQRVDGKTVVFIAHPDGKGSARFEQREVEIGSSAGGRSTIVRGVTATDVIVVSGAFAVKAELIKSKTPKMEM